MKRKVCFAATTLAALLSVVALTGAVAGAAGPNPVSPPHSIAFGKSLDQWMGAYWRWFLTGGPDTVKNVKFLPISGCSVPVGCAISVGPGTAFALPLAGWIGWDATDVLPDEWWGDPQHIYTQTFLDGAPIAEPNAAYYVGPTPFDPPVPSPNFLYQAIGVVIKPLPPGVHHLALRTVFVDFGPATFDNAWYISVVPPGRK